VLDGEPCYRISAYDRLPPFLVSVASDTDLWMFVSSAGGLTAGRRDADGALFPYETVDRLHDGHHHTGPITLLRVRRAGGPTALWQPFAERDPATSAIERNLYKTLAGDRLVFEEVRHELGLAFRYRWSGCEAFGLVRSATLEELRGEAVEVEVLDGLRNLLPWGAPLALYQHSSSLVDAYKRSDLDPATGMAIFSLTAGIVDRPEAIEVLRANVVWCQGLERPQVHLSLDALDAFRRGVSTVGPPTVTGGRGHYLAASRLELSPGGRARWHLAADVGLDHPRIEALRGMLQARGDLSCRIEEALDAATVALTRDVAGADGLQLTADAASDARHRANVLFNNMRGGVFVEGHDVPAADLREFVRARDRRVAERQAEALRSLPDRIPAPALLERAAATGDPGLLRLCHEYLPLTFGRRHGDPSRPWNRFSIRVRNADGSRALSYEGNWRDIFQNWEALAQSFPGFLPQMVAKFVNASTVDGFNPYRITREGIDWEVPDPRDPWSHIGYWGDHQIVYLLRLLEALDRTSPGTLEDLLGRDCFSYADVPYRLKPYQDLVADPHHTIDFDHGRAELIAARVADIGSDGALLPDAEGAIHHAGLLEKLLVPALSKLSNLVPGAGIWMNTQRPEWNDANNALVGYGVSVVTVCHLRRYLAFLAELVGRPGARPSPVAIEVAEWLRDLHGVLAAAAPAAAAGDAGSRRQVMDALGTAFSRYRAKVYADGFSGRTELTPAEVVEFCRVARAHIDHSVRANRREDGLYHSYNLLEFDPHRPAVEIRRLDEMLEGQVAAMSSGLVGGAEAVALVEAMFRSRLHRPDQRSFVLYPEKVLPSFLEKNHVPAAKVAAVPLLERLVGAGDHSVLVRDASGTYRFQAELRNRGALEAALDRLDRDPRWSAGVACDRQAVLEVFESVFHHHDYTGRSGVMYAYEGLGCVYWHMVSKLLLSVQEIARRAAETGEAPAVRDGLAAAYYRIRRGLGFEKSVHEYGAFPTDPYSHTPARGGAQQPGMTGQVKEDILSRFGELGVRVEGGLVGFRPFLLRRREFRREPGQLARPDGQGTVHAPADTLVFTYCAVPVLYRVGADPASIRVTMADGRVRSLSGQRLDAAASRALLARDGSIAGLEVLVPEQVLLDDEGPRPTGAGPA
jgi:hypothetical protein